MCPGWTAPVPTESREERILDFHSEIFIQRDGGLEVTEHIRVFSFQRSILRGIYRDFPTRRLDPSGRPIRVGFEVLEVLRDGRPEEWFTEKIPNGVRVNTGGDRLLPRIGPYTFTIRYRSTRQLGFFQDYDELYWNVTGLDWKFPIEQASADIHLPREIAGEDLELNVYTGPRGARGKNAVARVEPSGLIQVETLNPLKIGEGLTVSVAFPKGVVATPDVMQQFRWFLYDHIGTVVLYPGLGVLLLYYILFWRAKGRGPEAGPIVCQSSPPKHHSPAGLGYLKSRFYVNACFAADVVDLAVKGYLLLDCTQEGKKERWSLEKTRESLEAHEPGTQAVLFQALFEQGPRLELIPKHARRIQRILNAHTRATAALYRGAYIEPNLPVVYGGVAVSLAVIGSAVFLSGTFEIPGFLFSLFGFGILNTLFLFMMRTPTEQGRRLLDEVEGFQRYLNGNGEEAVDSPQTLERPPPAPAPDDFQVLLPYAIALELQNEWIRRFIDTIGESAVNHTLRRLNWVRGAAIIEGGLGKVMESIHSILTCPPSTTSGAGGGGASGGGGGGGGGGGR